MVQHAPRRRIGSIQRLRRVGCHLLNKTGMIRVIDDLERLGYVTRTPSTRDRRVTILALTSDGDQALRNAQQHTKRVSEELFHVSPHELTTLRSILMRTLTPSPTRLTQRWARR